MKSYVIAGLMIVGLVSPALAAAQHYAVEDTVGNCSVIDARRSANLKFLAIRVAMIVWLPPRKL